MSLFTLRERAALAGSIVAALVGAWAIPVLAQDKTSPPNFAPDPTVGWIGVGGYPTGSGHRIAARARPETSLRTQWDGPATDLSDC